MQLFTAQNVICCYTENVNFNCSCIITADIPNIFIWIFKEKKNLHALSLVFTVKIQEDGDSMQSFCIWDTLTSLLLLLHCILWISGCSNLIICCMRPLIFRLGQSTLLYSADLIYHCRESALVQNFKATTQLRVWQLARFACIYMYLLMSATMIMK